MIKYIVFDFDGTIADTFEVIKNIAINKDFNGKYTPEELRFYDYIDQKKIEGSFKESKDR